MLNYGRHDAGVIIRDYFSTWQGFATHFTASFETCAANDFKVVCNRSIINDGLPIGLCDAATGCDLIIILL